MENHCSYKPFFFSLIVLLVLGILSWFGVDIRNNLKEYQYIGQPEAQRDAINITGEGKVLAAPDIAEISLGLTVEKKDVPSAQKESTEKMNNLVKELKKLKIEEKDIQTTQYSISPKYDWNQGKQILRGYEVSQTLNVKIRDVKIAGIVLAKAGELGLNQAGNLFFTIDDPEKLKQGARLKALKNAKDKAEALAKAAGIKLGKITSFNESIDQPFLSFDKTYAMGAGGGAPAPNVQAGSAEIKITVMVSYEILNK